MQDLGWSRDLPAEPSSVRIYRDPLGHWYASFVVPARIEALPATGRAIGIDWGVKETATTTSDDHDLPHAEHGKKAADRLACYQRRMARRRPKPGQAASKGYRKAKRQAARLHKKIARQRQDTARKWAMKVVRDHDVLAVEDFRPKFLAKSTMARKAADAAIGATKAALIEMGRKHGRDVRLVHPAHTTMDCAGSLSQESPPFREGSSQGRPERRLRGRFAIFYLHVRSIADLYGCRLVDQWSMQGLRDWRAWSEDRLHMNEDGHRLVAARVLDVLGVPFDDWHQVWPDCTVDPRAKRREDAQWIREHLVPWVARRLRGTSSGDGLLPKRPDLSPWGV
ncbi:RNA-guided endonuclease TnpB family protein [Nonomuraea sp. NPDC000554]|uniref:RNA-guided endonuclease TnpB family protein n=1 Tax=Nonomuraea sp. NPDC000554 TaxID=3154259 RepID=UPI00332E62E9